MSGAPIPDKDLIRLLDDVERADQTQAAEPGGRIGTFFELTTAVALKWFLEQQVQMAVLETGMGGRLDSTNVVLPLISVITDIGLEHTSFLGDTLEKVAGEKAGIIKPGRPVVVGKQKPAAARVIEEKARAAGAPLLRADERVAVRRLSQDLDGQMLSIETADGAWAPFRLPLLGDFQLGNCALAITALEWMRDCARAAADAGGHPRGAGEDPLAGPVPGGFARSGLHGGCGAQSRCRRRRSPPS